MNQNTHCTQRRERVDLHVAGADVRALVREHQFALGRRVARFEIDRHHDPRHEHTDYGWPCAVGFSDVHAVGDATRAKAAEEAVLTERQHGKTEGKAQRPQCNNVRRSIEPRDSEGGGHG